uniref:Uncharacterized protein n=1 Tax=Sphaeramia orbicularis TaxID=375764 RepID=A0A673AVP9_9TELE
MNIPQNFIVAVLGVIPVGLGKKADKYTLNILFTAALKSITIRWMKPEPPSYTTWVQKVWDIYQMEQITFLLKLQKTTFTKRWEPMLPIYKCNVCEKKKDLYVLIQVFNLIS